MTKNKLEKSILQMVNENTIYGKTMRYFLAKNYNLKKAFYDRLENGETAEEIMKNEDDMEKLVSIEFVFAELTKGLAVSRKEHRTKQELKNWSHNFLTKCLYADFKKQKMPYYLKEVAIEWERDFEDICDGLCEGFFTEEMRKELKISVFEMGTKK